MPSIALTVLTDNTVHQPGLGSEHGFSLAIEADPGELWLLDTGASGLFLDNARALELDPSAARGVICSHGHYDHTGGLAALAATGWQGTVLGHPHILVERFKIRPGREPESIGMPKACKSAVQERFVPLPGVWTLRRGMTLLTNTPRLPGNYEAINGFALDLQGQRVDHVLDDAALVLDTASGPVLLLGCSHSGVANILSFCRYELGLERMHALLGGLHLADAPDWAVDQTAAVLREFEVERIHAGHCTGQKGLQALDKALPGRLHPLGAGLHLEFPPVAS